MAAPMAHDATAAGRFDQFLSEVERVHQNPAGERCFTRPHNGEPPWLRACLYAAHSGSVADRQRLARAALQAHDLPCFAGVAWSELPADLLEQALERIAWACGRRDVQLTSPTPFTDSDAVRLRGDFLKRWAGHALLPGATRFGDGFPNCSIPVLLVGPFGGSVAVLQLWRLHEPGADLRLVPMPDSAITPVDPAFSAALDDVRAWLQTVTCARGDANPQDTLLAWDLVPRNVPLAGLKGPSAGAAFALAGAWLLRDLLRDDQGPLSQALASIDVGVLTRVAVTARLAPDGRLWPVDDVDLKLESLRLFTAAFDDERLIICLAKDELRRPPAPVVDASIHEAEIERHATLTELAQAIARRAQPMTAAQRALHEALLVDDDPASISEETLRQVAEDDPRITLVHYLLARWARWAREDKASGAWRQRYVPVALALAPAQPRAARTHFNNVAQLLADRSNPRASAFLFRGSPGAGKTVLVRYHEQSMCLDALRAMAVGDPTEIPLYLRLAELPEPHSTTAAPSPIDVRGELIDRLHRRLKIDHPPTEHPVVHDLLALFAGSARKGIRLRLLLDGLNELKVPDGGDREQLARDIVLAWSGPPQRRHLAPLLFTRSHHPFRQREGELAPVQSVEILPWKPEDIRRYLRRRFADAEMAQRCYDALSANPHALALCSLPMHLAGQCEIFARPGGGAVVDDRARLYFTWLWQRLWRETREHGGKPLNPDLTSLLTPGDRCAIDGDDDDDGWLGEGWRDLPLGGPLLPTLFRQAAVQWGYAATKGMEVDLRGEVEVDLRTVAPWLNEADPTGQLRGRWLEAVQALGVALIEGRRGRETFRFAHQSWGEFFASRHLLTPHPDQMAPGALEALLRDAADPKLARSDAEELQWQEQQADQAWAEVPAALWDELFDNGLEVEVETFVQCECNDGYPRSAALEHLELVRKWGWLTIDAQQERCKLLWSAMGDDLEGRLCLGDGAGPWRRRLGAWRRMVIQWVPSAFEQIFWTRIDAGLASRLPRSLGKLELPPAGDLDEQLALALQALEKPVPWLDLLAKHGAVRAAARAAAKLRREIEPQEDIADSKSPQRLHPQLQDLRRRLLLRSVDGGACVLERVRSSGIEATSGETFAGDGLQLRQRLEAGLLLGELGDTLRFERANATGACGLRLKSAHWVVVGQRPGPRNTRPFTCYRIGDPDGEPNEKPELVVKLPCMRFAAYPVTVGEWRAFAAGGGYDPAKPWWQPDSAAGRWLRSRMGESPGRKVEPLGINQNPLHPIMGITWFEAMAYVEWARPMYEASDEWKLMLPTEVMWEAGMRGPMDGPRSRWPHPDLESDRMTFNHLDTTWGQSSPVGVFSRGYTPSGIADAAGNVWEWCSSPAGQPYRRCDDAEVGDVLAAGPTPPIDDDSTPRALRGGASKVRKANCRVAYRGSGRPSRGDEDLGMRLAWLWTPR